MRPRVCVADNKAHIRTFLTDALEELGFIPTQCGQINELGDVLDEHSPDLIVLGLTARGIDPRGVLDILAAKEFDGKILLLAPPASLMADAVRGLARNLGLEILPVLETPYSDEGLRRSLATLLPTDEPTRPPVNAAEALSAGWLELRYQPKIDTRSLALSGAEALVHLHHPSWGIVQPAYFIPERHDPHYHVLAEFLVSRVVKDWHDFLAEQRRIILSVNLPIAFFQRQDGISMLCQHVPDHPAFDGLIIEVNAAEVVQNLDLISEAAKRLRFHNVGISIEGLGEEWPSLVGLNEFPFVEIKLHSGFVEGSGINRLKRTVCRQIVELAAGYGVRTVAEGIEGRGDFLAMREIGVDAMQGVLLARPMPPAKLLRSLLRGPLAVPK
jgi:EAL domain-containing protein (putative c-di-GMP-specific phosphodiesterase class I)